MTKEFEPIDSGLVEDGLALLESGQAEYFIFVGDNAHAITEPVASDLDAAYFALIRAGQDPSKLPIGTAFLLSNAIARQARKSDQSNLDPTE